jgi:hypothetical protein
VELEAGKTYVAGTGWRRFRIGAMLRESSDGKWTSKGKLVRLRPFFTRRPDGFMVSLIVRRYCVGVAVIW